MTWATTYTGKAVHYHSPTPEQIDFLDILTSLSRNHRFSGFSPLKIAQHIVEVASSMAREVEEEGKSVKAQAQAFLVGLIHDFPEYIVGDCPTPFKRILGSAYAAVEQAVLDAILDKYEYRWIYSFYAELLAKHDKIAVHSEAIRYHLDGWMINTNVDNINDDAAEFEVERKWVPESAIQPFKEDVWDEEEAKQNLMLTFCQALILIDRVDLIPQWMRGDIAREVDGDYAAVLAMETPSVFLDDYLPFRGARA